METTLTRLETASEIVAKNRPLIAEKVQKAIDALKLIVNIETDEQDTFANNVLVKCNATMPVIQGLRKEYTSIINEWLDKEIEFENLLKAEMERIKRLRNDHANRKAAENREKQAAIDKQKKKDIEIARIKKEQVLAVQLGIANRISEGENAIAKMFDAMTLANIDSEGAKLSSIKPNLKEDMFRGFLAVDYDNVIVSYEEFKDICERAYMHFDYAKCNTEYISAVKAIIDKRRGNLEGRKGELTLLATGQKDVVDRLNREARERVDSEAAERSREAEAQRQAITKKATEDEANLRLDAEFKGQIQAQEIAPLEGVRGVISYRLKNEEELLAKPIKIVEIMGRIMVNVIADPAFKGIYKRDKAGIPKRDSRGNAEYIDAIQDWFDLLVKIKPAPEFEGIIKFEDVTTIAKAR